jgi:hypothetical protein
VTVASSTHRAAGVPHAIGRLPVAVSTTSTFARRHGMVGVPYASYGR